MASRDDRPSGSALQRVSTAALSIALYLVLGEALVEVWVAGSELRWLTTIILLTYATVTVLFWKRIGYGVKAGLSTLVLLLLVVFSAWRLGSVGAAGGVTALRLPTSTLATLAVTGALGLSTYLLATLPFLPRRGRIAVLVLGLYCLLPYVGALLGRWTFAEVQSGAAFLPRLPYWLHGAFITIYGILPLGFLAAMYYSLRNMRDQSIMQLKRWGFIGGSLALGLLLALPDALARVSIERALRDLKLPTFESAEVERIQTVVRRLTDPGLLPPSTAAELASQFGGDPIAILKYVRDHLNYEPYIGALRGSRGVLLSGGGNDVDFMLLLRDVLRAARPDIPLRFVYAPMPASISGKAKWAISQPVPSVEDLARITGLARSEVEADLRDPAGAAEVQALAQEAAEEARFIEAHLSGLQVDAPSIPREHWWLRARVADNWTNLDPLLQTGDPAHDGSSEVSEIPEALHHRIGLRLVLERIGQGGLTEELLYRQHWKTTDLAGETITMVIAPEDFEQENLRDVLSRANRFQAAVRVGEQVEFSKVFDLDGAVYVARGSKFEKAVEGLGERIFPRPVGGPTPSDQPSPGSPPSSSLAGIRLEIEISSPGETPRIHRRWILDRLDHAAQGRGQLKLHREWNELRRVRASLVRSYRLFPVVGPVGPAMVADDISVLVLDRTLAEAARVLFEEKRVSDLSSVPSVSLFPKLLLVHLMRFAQGVGTGNERGALIFGRPGVLVYRESLEDEAGAISFREAVDVVAGGVTTRIPQAAFRYGAALSYAERDALIGGRRGMAAIDHLARRRKDGVRFHLIRSAQDLQSLPWPEAVRVRMADQIAAGFALLVPELKGSRDPRTLGWWRVDPRDGVPIATAPTGEGQTIIEGTIMLREVSIPQVERTLKYVACINKAVGGGAAPQQANAECLCKFLGDTLTSSAERFVRSKAVEKISKGGLGPKVQLILSQGIKYFNKLYNIPPKQPIDRTCEALTR